MIGRETSAAMDETASFFHALAPALVANVLTVVFVYCFAMINQREKRGEEGRLTHIWLIVIVLLLMLYGLYTWDIYPFKKN
jgi:succinate dehydrogenase hydrophobic anchor subunit